MTLEVREARPDELADCAELYVRVLRETFTWLPKDRHDKADFLRFAREEETYVAVEDGRIVGVAGFFRPQNFLHSLYVDARGKGVGKALLDHIVSVADGPVSLKVQEPNRRAQAFYAREGFACVEMGRDPGSDVSWRRLVQQKRTET
ncbi:GNAT family N-acetyltransferase [Phenylobacterium sp.]|uniref:GNAT family N-acetyltransferase n=1 Tax=Phenylobacterium sp. TaxID=1871053 RepID=UPI002F94789A